MHIFRLWPLTRRTIFLGFNLVRFYAVTYAPVHCQYYYLSVNHSPSLLGPWHMLQKPAAEIGAVGLNSTPDSVASFSCWCMTSNVVDVLWARKQSLTLQVMHWHKKLASNLWCWFLELVSEACVALHVNKLKCCPNSSRHRLLLPQHFCDYMSCGYRQIFIPLWAPKTKCLSWWYCLIPGFSRQTK